MAAVNVNNRRKRVDNLLNLVARKGIAIGLAKGLGTAKGLLPVPRLLSNYQTTLKKSNFTEYINKHHLKRVELLATSWHPNHLRKTKTFDEYSDIELRHAYEDMLDFFRRQKIEKIEQRGGFMLNPTTGFTLRGNNSNRKGKFNADLEKRNKNEHNRKALFDFYKQPPQPPQSQKTTLWSEQIAKEDKNKLQESHQQYAQKIRNMRAKAKALEGDMARRA